MKLLSKSQFIESVRCPKLAWTRWNAPHLIPPPDRATQANLAEGQRVGVFARQLFPQGIEIGGKTLIEAASNTKKALQQRRPLYEAAFVHEGCCVRVDLLIPTSNGGWQIVEVKSSTAVDDVHIQDIAFQAHVLAGVGIKVERYYLAHIDRTYMKSGPIDPHGFFNVQDVTDQIFALRCSIANKLNKILLTVRLPGCPNVSIGSHCEQPHPCPLKRTCWRSLPPASPVELYRGGGKRFDLLNRGITKLADIPDNISLTANQSIQRQTAKSGVQHINRTAIKLFLQRLQYPIALIDFETVGAAIPIFDGTRPFQAVPIQFSAHVLPSPDSEPEHLSFLASGGTTDPRPDFMRHLRDVLPSAGSVVVFNAAFESARLKECCELMPDFRPWVESVQRRLVDLLEPFRKFYFYDVRQAGSCSIKSILPLLTVEKYDGLSIRNGAVASSEFVRVSFGGVPEDERERVRRALNEYCKQDTQALISIIAALRTLMEGP